MKNCFLYWIALRLSRQKWGRTEMPSWMECLRDVQSSLKFFLKRLSNQNKDHAILVKMLLEFFLNWNKKKEKSWFPSSSVLLKCRKMVLANILRCTPFFFGKDIQIDCLNYNDFPKNLDDLVYETLSYFESEQTLECTICCKSWILYMCCSRSYNPDDHKMRFCYDVLPPINWKSGNAIFISWSNILV